MSNVDLDSYLGDEERTLATAQAKLRTVGDIDGTLACTPGRVVFVSETGITDVATDDVIAIEFREARFPLWNAVIGVVLSVIGGFLLAVAWSGAGRPVTTVLGSVLLLVGVVTLALGARDRAATLKLRTAARSFEFSGDEDDLAGFPGAIRDPPDRPD